MQRNRAFLILGLFALLSYGCAITMPIGATANETGDKVGTSSATCYFYTLCFDQDASIQAAAKDGGITKIATVDIKTKNILGIIVTYETIVTGQ
jgi:hypothetical protein